MEKRYTLRLPASMVRALAAAAKARHLSVADVVREALAAYLAKKEAA